MLSRTYPRTAQTWTVMVNECSNNRRDIVTDAVNYLDDLKGSLCHVTTHAGPKSCDINTVNACLEDFGAIAYFADPNVDVCE